MRRLVLALALIVTNAAAAQTEKGRPFLVLDPEGHTDAISGLVFTKDGGELTSVSRDKTIRFWDVASGEMLRVLRPPVTDGQAGSLYAVALAPDG